MLEKNANISIIMKPNKDVNSRRDNLSAFCVISSTQPALLLRSVSFGHAIETTAESVEL